MTKTRINKIRKANTYNQTEKDLHETAPFTSEPRVIFTIDPSLFEIRRFYN